MDAESVIPDALKNVLVVLAVEDGDADCLDFDAEGANFSRVEATIGGDGVEVVVTVDSEKWHSVASSGFFGVPPV